MTEEQLQLLKESIAGTVRETVNGKIDKLTTKLDAHIEDHRKDTNEIKAFLELRRGALVLGSIGKWMKDMTVYFFLGWELIKLTIK